MIGDGTPSDGCSVLISDGVHGPPDEYYMLRYRTFANRLGFSFTTRSLPLQPRSHSPDLFTPAVPHSRHNRPGPSLTVGQLRPRTAPGSIPANCY